MISAVVNEDNIHFAEQKFPFLLLAVRLSFAVKFPQCSFDSNQCENGLFIERKAVLRVCLEHKKIIYLQTSNWNSKAHSFLYEFDDFRIILIENCDN
jgi:hypothetical protein